MVCNKKRKPVFIKRKWNHVFSMVTILSFHPVYQFYSKFSNKNERENGFMRFIRALMLTEIQADSLKIGITLVDTIIIKDRHLSTYVYTHIHTPYPRKFQHYWRLTIRSFSVISKTVIGGVLHLCRDVGYLMPNLFYTHTYIYIYMIFTIWFGWVLSHINHCRLFNTKSFLYIYIKNVF